MIINTVKKQENGYLVNGEIFVPESAGNRDYVAVLEWIDAGNTPEHTALDELKQSKIAELNDAFNSFFESGSFKSSLGFIADCRRSSTKNDLQNIEGLIATYVAPVDFKVTDGTRYRLDKADLEVLRIEIIQRGQIAYSRKWAIEDAINNSSSIEELEAIIIEI